MKFSDLEKAVRGGEVQPIYFLHGKEPHFIDALSHIFEHELLPEAARAFNLTVLYGKEIDHLAVVDAARRYPVMAQRQVVIVKEAQSMRGLNDLAAYAEQPSSTTVLVLCHKHKKFDSRKKLFKTLKKSKQAVVFESKPLYDNQVPGWIQQYLKSKGYGIDAKATQLLADFLGSNLAKLANELGKLTIGLPKNSKIDAALIQRNIGISKDYNVFELQKALALRDRNKAYRIVQYFIANPKDNPLPMVLGALYGFFSKLYIAKGVQPSTNDAIAKALGIGYPKFANDYRLAAQNYSTPQIEQGIALLKEFDLRFKGLHNRSADGGELLREMVYKIMLHEPIRV